MATTLKSIIAEATGLPLWIGDNVAGVQVTVKIAERHKFSSRTTEVTLENGCVVTDHVLRTPNEIEVAFEMSNAGLGAVAEAKTAFEKFYSLLESRELLSLITEHKIYSNVVLIDFSPIHQAPNKGTISCTATFKEVNFVQFNLEGKQTKNLKPSVKKLATDAVTKGVQGAKTLAKSELKSMYDTAKAKLPFLGGLK